MLSEAGELKFLKALREKKDIEEIRNLVSFLMTKLNTDAGKAFGCVMHIDTAPDDELMEYLDLIIKKIEEEAK